jgi:hypothetical protein
MSWSISLSGGKKQVQDELRHAAIEIGHAMDALDRASGPLVNVSVSGSSFSTPTDSNGNSNNGTGASFNVGSYAPEPAPPQPQGIPTEEVSSTALLRLTGANTIAAA